MAKQTFTTGQVLTAAQMTSLQQTAMLGGAASAKTASYTLVATDAGTAISMSSASATTITVNTALFAAGDTVQITNLGAGVCTITAGTATVNSSASLALAQYESGTLDFTSTSAAIFIKGAGAAPTVTSGMTLITRQTFSAVSTLTIDNLFSDTYENYFMNITYSGSENGNNVRIRGRYGTTTHVGNDYYSALNGVMSSGTDSNLLADAQSIWIINTVQQTTDVPSTCNFNFFRSSGSAQLSFSGTGMSNDGVRGFGGGGVIKNSQAWTGLYFFLSGGNITGTFTMYGLAKA